MAESLRRGDFGPRRRSRSIGSSAMRRAPRTPYTCSARSLPRRAIGRGRSRSSRRAYEHSVSSATSTTPCWRLMPSRGRMASSVTANAARLLSRVEVLGEEVGGVPSWVGEMNEKTLTTIRAQLDEAAFAEAWERGQALSVDEAVALALDS